MSDDLSPKLPDEIVASTRRLASRIAGIGDRNVDFTPTAAAAITEVMEPYWEDHLQWMAVWRQQDDIATQVSSLGVRFAVEVLDILTEPSSGVNVNNAYTQRDILRAVRDELEVMAAIIDRTIESEEQPA
jgi:hypothetical protein